MTVRIALIGTGNIAAKHIEAIKNCKDASFVAIMSHDKTRAEEFGKKYNVKFYSDINELLKDSEIDAVDIINQHNLHVEYALKAINAGKHVLIEKPIGTSLDGIDNLIAKSKSKKLVLGIVSQHRFDETIKEAKRIIESGELGKILFVNADLINSRGDNYYQSSKWRKSKEESGGGVLIMNAIHLVDSLLWMFGEAKSVYSSIRTMNKELGVEDNASLLIKMKDDVAISLHATTSAEYNDSMKIKVYGQKKSIMIDGDNLIELSGTNKFSRIKSAIMRRLPVKIMKSRRYQLGSINDQINDFIDSIKQDKSTRVTAEDGKRALQVVLAAYKSDKSGKEIIINE